ncbi:MAG: hypothetical protein AAFS10_25595, partial [Myxococcota bacterium]
GRYLWLSLAPVGLSYDYTYAAIPIEVNLMDPYLLVGSVALMASVVGTLALWKREEPWARAALGSLGAFFVSYALFSNTLFLIVILFAERLFLAPSLWLIATCAALSEGVAQSPDGERAARLLAAGALLVVLLQTPLAVVRTLEWRSNMTLFQAQVSTQPNSLKGRLAYAQALISVNQPHEALWHFGVAVAGRGAFPEPWQAPTEADRLPVAQRLAMLPRLIAPGAPPELFLENFRPMATKMLGPGVHEALDTIATVTQGAHTDPRSDQGPHRIDPSRGRGTPVDPTRRTP